MRLDAAARPRRPRLGGEPRVTVSSSFVPAGRVNPSAGPRRAVIQIKRLGARDNRAYDARSLAVESQAPAAERPIALPPASVGAYDVDDDIRDDVNRGHLS